MLLTDRYGIDIKDAATLGWLDPLPRPPQHPRPHHHLPARRPPPYPTLLHGLRHHRTTAEAWHPWMLRILDIPEAIRLRGWPDDVTTAVPIEIENEDGDRGRWMLQIKAGTSEIFPLPRKGETCRSGEVKVTPCHWRGDTTPAGVQRALLVA